MQNGQNWFCFAQGGLFYFPYFGKRSSLPLPGARIFRNRTFCSDSRSRCASTFSGKPLKRCFWAFAKKPPMSKPFCMCWGPDFPVCIQVIFHGYRVKISKTSWWKEYETGMGMWMNDDWIGLYVLGQNTFKHAINCNKLCFQYRSHFVKMHVLNAKCLQPVVDHWHYGAFHIIKWNSGLHKCCN